MGLTKGYINSKIEPIGRALKSIKCTLEDILVALGSPPTSEPTSPDFEVICVVENDNLYVADYSTSPPTIRDFDGNVVTGTVTPGICPVDTLDVEYVDICVDGVQYTRADVIDTSEAIKLDDFWLDFPAGAMVSDPTPTATTIVPGVCPEVSTCVPLIQEFDMSEGVTAFIDFTSISVYTDGCCMATVDTSAGIFRVRPGVKVFSSSVFNCPVVLNGITLEEGCDPSSVVIFLENNG